MRLLDHATGAFLCEECHAELDANIEAAGLGGSSGAASRQQLQQYAKRMLEKMETQLRPILGALVCAPREGGIPAMHCWGQWRREDA